MSIREIADAADVSTTTLFKHFSGKEALVFDREQSNEAELIAAVKERANGRSVVDALREYVLGAYLPLTTHPQAAEFVELVNSTPVLRAYAERMWTRHTATLGAAIADELGRAPDDVTCVALARFVLDIPAVAQGRAAVEAVFDLLTYGWVHSVEKPIDS